MPNKPTTAGQVLKLLLNLQIDPPIQQHDTQTAGGTVRFTWQELELTVGIDGRVQEIHEGNLVDTPVAQLLTSQLGIVERPVDTRQEALKRRVLEVRQAREVDDEAADSLLRAIFTDFVRLVSNENPQNELGAKARIVLEAVE